MDDLWWSPLFSRSKYVPIPILIWLAMRFCSELQWLKPSEWVDPTTFPPAPAGGWHLGGFRRNISTPEGRLHYLAQAITLSRSPTETSKPKVLTFTKKAVNVNGLASDQIPAELMALQSASAIVFGSWHKVVHLFLEKQAAPKRWYFCYRINLKKIFLPKVYYFYVWFWETEHQCTS